MGHLPPPSTEMQVFDNQNYADKQHGLYYLIAPEHGDIPFHGINIPDQALWRSPEPTWQMGDSITEQHMTNQFGHSREVRVLTPDAGQGSTHSKAAIY